MNNKTRDVWKDGKAIANHKKTRKLQGFMAIGQGDYKAVQKKRRKLRSTQKHSGRQKLSKAETYESSNKCREILTLQKNSFPTHISTK